MTRKECARAKQGAAVLRLVLCAAIAGCGDGTGPSNDTELETGSSGSFQVTVSGDLALSLSGSAVFGIQTQQGQRAFAIGFIKGDPGSNDSDFIVIARNNTSTPGPGTYTIVSGSCTTCTENDFASGFLHQVTSLDFGIYLSESGSLTLESVSSELLQGSFSFTATAFLKGGSVTAENLTIEGTFIAVPGDIPSIS